MEPSLTNTLHRSYLPLSPSPTMSSVTSHIAAADRITTYSQEVDARTWGGFMSNQCLAVVGRVGRETEQVTRRIKRAFPQQTDLGGPYPTSQEVLPLAILFFVESDLWHLDFKHGCSTPAPQYKAVWTEGLRMDDILWQQSLITLRHQTNERAPGVSELTHPEQTLWRLMQYGLCDQNSADQPWDASTQ